MSQSEQEYGIRNIEYLFSYDVIVDPITEPSDFITEPIIEPL